jgi:hypothetical protein
MKGKLRLGLLTLVTALALLKMGAAPAIAQAAYDGQWSVLVITDAGTCDRAYRYPVRISRGRVGHAHPENTTFNIRGRVGKGGVIHVTVSRGDKRADGIGRLTRNGGTGKWKSSRGECSGKWQAERRGA